MDNRDQLKFVDRFSLFATNHRMKVMVVVLIIALLFSFGIFKIKGKVVLEEMLPYDHPFLKIIFNFSESFGTGGSWAGISVKANNGDIFKESILKKIQNIDSEVADWEETYRILTFSIGSRSAKVIKVRSGGEITIDPLMWPDIPKTFEEMNKLRHALFSDPAIRQIVSNGGRSTLIQTEFKSDISYEASFKLLQGLVNKYSDDETTLEINGFPVLMGWIYNTKGQIIYVMSVSIAVMILILFIIFRNIIGMAVPLGFGIISTAMGLGFIGWTGINFSPLLYVLAFLVAARMVSHAVQITHRYLEEYDQTGENFTA